MQKNHRSLFIGLGAIIIFISLFLWREILNYQAIITKQVSEPILASTPTELSVGPACNCRVVGNGEIWIAEYLDLNDSKSRNFHKTLYKFAKNYPTKVQLFFKNSPVAGFFGDNSLANKAAWCAAKQNKLEGFLDALMTEKNVKEKALRASAATARINMDAWWECTNSTAASAAVKKEVEEAQQLKLGKPPLIFINNKKINTSQDFNLEELLLSLLAE